MDEMEKLLVTLRLLNEQLNDEVIKSATKEQLLEYSVLINKIKAVIDSII